METQLIEYISNHPGQFTNGFVVLALAIFGKWFIGRLQKAFDKQEKTLEALANRVSINEGGIVNNRHILVGATGDNGLVSLTRENHNRLNKHDDRLADLKNEIGNIKTRLNLADG